MTNMTPFEVSSAKYQVRCNDNNGQKAFSATLEFDISLMPDVGNDVWVEKALADIKACLVGKMAIK